VGTPFFMRVGYRAGTTSSIVTLGTNVRIESKLCGRHDAGELLVGRAPVHRAALCRAPLLSGRIDVSQPWWGDAMYAHKPADRAG
jgi:hypothetical protein